jgi:hypothetical protein
MVGRHCFSSPFYRHRLVCAAVSWSTDRRSRVRWAAFNLPGAALFEARIRQHTIALMLLTYLGSLKSLQFFEPSYISVRLPVILLGGLTVWPVVRLVELMHGRRAAWIAGSSSPPIPPSFSPLASTGDQWRSNTS